MEVRSHYFISRRRLLPRSLRRARLASTAFCSAVDAAAPAASGLCRSPRLSVVASQRSLSRWRRVSRRVRRSLTSTTSPFLDTASVGVVCSRGVHASRGFQEIQRGRERGRGEQSCIQRDIAEGFRDCRERGLIGRMRMPQRNRFSRQHRLHRLLIPYWEDPHVQNEWDDNTHIRAT